MSDVLTKICATTAAEVAKRKSRLPLDVLEDRVAEADAPRGFAKALMERHRQGTGPALICEIKKASPSKGLIRADFDPPALARAYQDGGATCLSVLTDGPYFQGADGYMVAARDAVSLPVLRKDFMVDPWQILESRALGADCILLIMACLSDAQAAEMHDLATRLGMDVLIETHDQAELERALALPSPLIGLNNRNLKTLDVTLDTTRTLAPLVPDDRLLVCESGIFTRQDIDEMTSHGAGAFLIGESLMRQQDVTAATRSLTE
ncbi:MAG: indole-3-glycerol phosphate synthase TrpC [Alphaproteobacteria bacterium]